MQSTVQACGIVTHRVMGYLAIAAALLLVVADGAMAQRLRRPMPEFTPLPVATPVTALDQTINDNMVTVADSYAAISALTAAAQARQLAEANGDWTKAAELYLAIIEKHAAALLPEPGTLASDSPVAASDPAGGATDPANAARSTEAGQATGAASRPAAGLGAAAAAGPGAAAAAGPGSVMTRRLLAAVVNQQILQWPTAGLEAYRQLAEPLASAALHEASAQRDVPALLRIAEDYFATTSGQAALELAADTLADRGDPGTAAVYLRRLLGHGDADRLTVLARLAMWSAWSGNESAASAWFEQLKATSKERSVVTAVRDVPGLLARVETAITEPPPLVFDEVPLGILTGDLTRSRAWSTTADVGVSMWSQTFRDASSLSVTSQTVDPDARTLEEDLSLGRFLHCIPAISQGVIILQDATFLRALSLISGARLWERPIEAKYSESPRQARIFWGDNELLPVPAFAPSIFGSRVYVSVAANSLISGWGESAVSPSLLLCVDLQTGRDVWSLDSGRASMPQRLRNARFDGSPIVYNDRLYIAARTQTTASGATPEDVSLLCLDPENGQLIWHTPLSGAPMLSRQTLQTWLAADAGRIFAITQAGALAAVDARTGRIDWLHLYRRRAVDDSFSPFGIGGGFDIQGWKTGTPMVVGTHVVALPDDSEQLLVVDRDTGALQASVNRSSLGGVDLLIGAVDQTVIGVSRSQVLAIDLKRLTGNSGNAASADRSAKDAVRVLARLDTGSVGRLTGRPALSDRTIYLPTTDALLLVPLASSSTGPISADEDTPDLANRPPQAAAATGPDESPSDAAAEGVRKVELDVGIQPGHVTVLGSQLVMVGSTVVTSYCRWEDARGSLLARIAAAPREMAPRLEYAEVALRADSANIPTAIEQLDEIVHLAGGWDGAWPGGTRERVFQMLLTFGRQYTRDLPRRGASKTTAADVEALLARANRAASNGSQRVMAILEFSEFLQSQQRWVDAVAVLQQVLDDDILRGEMVDTSDTWGVSWSAAEPVAESDTESGDDSEPPSRRSVDATNARNPQDDSRGSGQVARSIGGSLASGQIHRVLTRSSMASYAAIEDRARKALELALEQPQDQRVAALDQVLRQFPNSRAAIATLREKAAWFDANQRPDLAYRTLGQAWSRRWRDRLIEAGPDVAAQWVADLSQRAKRLGLERDAAQRLRAARDLLGNRTVRGGDGQTTLDDLLGQLADAPRSNHLPDVPESLAYTYTVELRDGEVLEPTLATTPPRHDLIVVYLQERVHVLEAATGRLMFAPISLPRLAPRGLLAILPDELLLQTRFSVHSIDLATGRQRWVWGDPVQRVAVDPENVVAIQSAVLTDDALLLAVGRSSGTTCQLVSINLQDGSERHRHQVEMRPIGQLAVSPDGFAVCAARVGEAAAMVVLDIDTATIVHVLPGDITDGSRLVHYGFAPTGQIVGVSQETLWSFDPMTGLPTFPPMRLRTEFIHTLSFASDGFMLMHRRSQLTKRSYVDGQVMYTQGYADVVDDAREAPSLIPDLLVDGDTVYIAHHRNITALDMSPQASRRRLWSGAPRINDLILRSQSSRYILAINSASPRAGVADRSSERTAPAQGVMRLYQLIRYEKSNEGKPSGRILDITPLAATAATVKGLHVRQGAVALSYGTRLHVLTARPPHRQSFALSPD